MSRDKLSSRSLVIHMSLLRQPELAGVVITLCALLTKQKSKTIAETNTTSFVVSPFVPAAATLVGFLVGCFGSTWDVFLGFLLVSWYIVLIVLLPLFLQFINHPI